LTCLPNLEISQFWYPELARINFERELLVVFPNILF
jgi:hypothetical protein